MTTNLPINTRNLTLYKSLTSELHYAPDKNYLFDLSYLISIDVEGKSGNEFLQGQLSCNIQEIDSKQMRQGALCNLKGRVLALIDVIDWPEQGLSLILPQDLLQNTLTSLEKTAQLSRVKLLPSNKFQILGFHLSNLNDLVPFNIKLPEEKYSVIYGEHYYCYSLGNNFYIFLIAKEHANSLVSLFSQASQWRGSLAWHALQLQHHQIEIYPESRGLFLPHRLGLQLSGYLSFNKGCYKGQEIIARTHYRAKLKHELKLFIIQTNEPLQSGKKVFNGDIEIGELIDYCPISDEKCLIAVSMVFEHPEQARIEGHTQDIVLKKLL